MSILNEQKINIRNRDWHQKHSQQEVSFDVHQRLNETQEGAERFRVTAVAYGAGLLQN